MRIALITVVVCLLALPALAGDLTGTWSGTIELTGPDGDRTAPVLLILKQSGSEITGSGGGGEDDQHPIKNGKIEGDTLTFEVHQERDDGTRIYKLVLTMAGDKLEGTIQRDETKGKVSATRKKSG